MRVNTAASQNYALRGWQFNVTKECFDSMCRICEPSVYWLVKLGNYLLAIHEIFINLAEQIPLLFRLRGLRIRRLLDYLEPHF